MGQLKYKNFIGSVEYNEEDNLLVGKVQGIRGLISYEGSSLDELKADFEGAIDDYLEVCKIKGVKPQKSYSGSFNVRLSPELHSIIAKKASDAGVSLNAFVKNTLQNAIM